VFGSAAVQVATGVILVYVLLSLICSGISDVIGHGFAWRAKYLRAYVERLLGADTSSGRDDRVDRFYDHPLMAAATGVLLRRRKVYPERLPPHLFASILLDTTGQRAKLDRAPALHEVIGSVSSPQLQRTLRVLYDETAGDAERFRAALADLLAYGQQTLEQQYRQRLRITMVVAAAAIVIALDIDTIQLAKDMLALATVAEADLRGPTNLVPIDGWGSEIESFSDVLAKAIGLALTIGAVAFGSEFWMGILNRLTGKGEAKSSPPSPRGD
jgi:hypothetical protein